MTPGLYLVYQPRIHLVLCEYVGLRAALHERPSQPWGQWKAKSSLVIGPNSEIGPRGLTWGVKANFLKQFFNAWGTRSNTARAPKIGRYKNGKPFLSLGAVSENPLKNIFFGKKSFFQQISTVGWWQNLDGQNSSPFLSPSSSSTCSFFSPSSCLSRGRRRVVHGV